VVVTDLAFMSNAYPWLAGRSAGAEVRFVESRHGKIYMEDLTSAVDKRKQRKLSPPAGALRKPY